MSAIAIQRPASSATAALVARRSFHIGKLTIFYLVLAVGGAVFLVPYVFALFGSLKTENLIYTTPAWVPPHHPVFSIYSETWGTFSQVQTEFSGYFWNTLMVTVALMVGQVFFSMMAAYAFARMRFPGRDTIFWMYLLTLMIPNIVTIIPLYTIMDKLHLVNTYWAVFLPYALGTPYTIFLMRQFFKGIPQELLDSARLDGCGEFGVLKRVVLPLSRPVIITAALIAFVFGWNNFLWPLVVTGSQSHYLLTVGLANFTTGPGTDEYTNIVLAGAMITLIPMIVVFVIFNRYIVRSIQLTSGR